MNTHTRDDRRSAEQAAEWLHRVKTDGHTDREAFANWLLESRRNVRQSLLTIALERELKSVDSQRRFDVDAMLREGSNDVITLEPQTAYELAPQRRMRTWGFGIAASVAVLAAAWAFFMRAPVIETATGEQQSVQLDDGSVVHLNTQSKIRVTFSERERSVNLLEGEALFSVEDDAARPFRVQIGDVVVQALGTQFNVDHHGPLLEISVVEGSVRVANTTGAEVATAGEEVTLSPDGQITKVANPNVRRSIAWRERRLEFQEDSLSEAVAEFNRYNRALKLKIEGDIGHRKYTGIFNADDPESLAQILSEESDLQLERIRGEIVIRKR